VVTHELGMTELQFQSTVVSLYKKSIDGEAAKVLLDKASGDKKQEQKKKFLEQVANKGPEDFLKETIDERLKLLTCKKGAKSSGKGTSSAELAVAAIQSHTGKISPDQAQQILANTTLPTPAPKAKQKPLPKSKGKGVPFAGKGAGGKGQKGKSKGKGKGKSAPALTKEKAKTSQKTSCTPCTRGVQSPKERALVAKKAGTNGPVERGPTGGSETKTNVQLVLAHG